MTRVALALLNGVVLAALVACGQSTTPSPTAPMPPNVSVNGIVVSSVVKSPTTVQLTATANLSDGSTRDVTATASWQSSDVGIAVISSAGVMTVVGSGAVDVRATFQSVTGSLRLVVAKPVDTPTHFSLEGVVREVQPSLKSLSGVSVHITSGVEAGTFVVSDLNGVFKFPSLSTGQQISLEVAHNGYLVWKLSNLSMDTDRVIEVDLYPTPPTNPAGASATARCKDGTWSWALTLGEACTDNGGIAYTVCPGPICAPISK
jgi:hypothetical protein